MSNVYIFNGGRYALAFAVKAQNGYEKTIEIDKRRFFQDTGNLATTGVTEVTEEDYKLLVENSRFKELIDNKELTLVEREQMFARDETALKLAEENKKLKEELEQAKKGGRVKDNSRIIEEKDKEIDRLKKTLERVTKSKEEF